MKKNLLFIILILGLAIRLIYLSYTNFYTRSHDVGAHIQYIEYLANNLQIPPPEKGWEYFQAPLYYITGAIVYEKAIDSGVDPFRNLQVLSLIYSMIAMVFGILILKLFFIKNHHSRFLFYSSALLLIFWPTGILHGVRISNEPMYYMLSIISLYFIISWVSFKKIKDLHLSAIFIALTLAVKLSGIILAGTLFMLLLLQVYILWLRRKSVENFWIKVKPILFQIFFIFTILFLVFFLIYYRDIKAMMTIPNFGIDGTNVTMMPAELAVNNAPESYLTFDLNIFINKVFTSPYEDKEYFWNFLLKTMLFGEWSYSTPFNISSVKVINITFLCMFPFFFIGLIYASRKITQIKLALLIYFFLALASLIYYRYHNLFACYQDFRFIFPIIIPCLYFYFSGINWLHMHKYKFFSVLGYLISYIFIIAVCVFFLSPLNL